MWWGSRIFIVQARILPSHMVPGDPQFDYPFHHKLTRFDGCNVCQNLSEDKHLVLFICFWKECLGKTSRSKNLSHSKEFGTFHRFALIWSVVIMTATAFAHYCTSMAVSNGTRTHPWYWYSKCQQLQQLGLLLLLQKKGT